MELCFTTYLVRRDVRRSMRSQNRDEKGASPRWVKWLQLASLAAVTILVGTVLIWAVGENVSGGSGEAHRVPGFAQSFGFQGLALSGAYLAALGVWGWIRRDWTFVVRHVVSAAAMLLLVVAYLGARGGLGYNGHSWNQSFADASVILYAVTLAIGPLARLWRPASQALAWRRETSIWATIAATMHVGIFWEWSLGWDWRPFFYPGNRGTAAGSLGGDPATGLTATAFHVANVVGLIALAYALLLALTSNDASQRRLKSGWSWLQKRATTMWLLVLLHTWVFAYYVTFGTTIATTLWLSFWVVLVLQTAGFVKTVRGRRLARATALPEPMSPT